MNDNASAAAAEARAALVDIGEACRPPVLALVRTLAASLVARGLGVAETRACIAGALVAEAKDLLDGIGRTHPLDAPSPLGGAELAALRAEWLATRPAGALPIGDRHLPFVGD